MQVPAMNGGWGPWSAPDIEEFQRGLWLNEIKQRLRLVTTGETWIRSMHRDGFRSGQWARLLWNSEIQGRRCYHVRFGDGQLDDWVINDPDGQYEFFPPTRFTGLLAILNGEACR